MLTVLAARIAFCIVRLSAKLIASTSIYFSIIAKLKVALALRS
jgi:hypothetical protein